MEHFIISKAKLILGHIDYGLDLAMKWDEEYFDYFYKFFAHPDKEVRKYALLVFAAGLGNWNSGSATIFTPYKLEPIKYVFNDYIKSFMANKESIKLDFPAIYNQIMVLLFNLKKENELFSLVHLMDEEVIKDLETLLTETNSGSLKYGAYDELLTEVNE